MFCPKIAQQLPSRSSAATLPRHTPRSPKQAPGHCWRQPTHLGQRDVLSLISKSPPKAAQGSQAGPGLPQRCCGLSLEGTAGSGCTGSTQCTWGFISLPESLHPQDTTQLRWFLTLEQGWELSTGLSAPTASVPVPITPFQLTKPGALSPALLCASFPQGLLIPVPTAGYFPVASGSGKLCPLSSRGGISGTYLQRGGHGLAAAGGRADTQAPWNADGVWSHR